jgi:hypothetical protein
MGGDHIFLLSYPCTASSFNCLTLVSFLALMVQGAHVQAFSKASRFVRFSFAAFPNFSSFLDFLHAVTGGNARRG